MCIRRNIRFKLLKDVYFPSGVEGLAVEVHTATRSITFVLIYQSPCGGRNVNCNTWDKFFKQFQKKNTIILCDFNAHHIAWNCKNTNVNGSILFEICTNNSFFVINYDTLFRFGGVGQSSSKLDLALCSGDLLSEISYFQINDTWGSDHFPIEYTFSYKAKLYNKVTNRISNKKTDWNEYVKYLNYKLDYVSSETFLRQHNMDKYRTIVGILRDAVISATPCSRDYLETEKLHIALHSKRKIGHRSNPKS